MHWTKGISGPPANYYGAESPTTMLCMHTHTHTRSHHVRIRFRLYHKRAGRGTYGVE